MKRRTRELVRRTPGGRALTPGQDPHGGCEPVSHEHVRHALRTLSPSQRLASFHAMPPVVQNKAWEVKARACAEQTEHLRDPLELDRSPQPAATKSSRRRPPRPSRPKSPGFHDDPLLEVDAAVYFEVLAGVEVPANRMVRCPLPDHEDRTPSCSVTGAVWHCFGCGRSGRIYDLAAELWGYGTRGSDFIELRRRLAEELLGALA